MRNYCRTVNEGRVEVAPLSPLSTHVLHDSTVNNFNFLLPVAQHGVE